MPYRAFILLLVLVPAAALADPDPNGNPIKAIPDSKGAQPAEPKSGCDNAGLTMVNGPMNCDWRKKYLSEKLENKKSISDIVDTVVKPESKVIFLGEDHSHSNGRKAYPRLIEMLQKKSPEIDCIFLEADHTKQSALDDYMLKGKSHKAAFKKTSVWNARQELLDLAKKLKIKVYAIDTKSDDITKRNVFMTGQITSRLDNGTCHKAVMPVGKNHIRGENPIPDLLAKKGVPSARLNVQTTDPEDADLGNEWFRPDCEWNPAQLKEEFGFTTQDLVAPAMSKPILANEAVTTWNKFDATIVIP